jgi:signal transduction histidine kinase
MESFDAADAARSIYEAMSWTSPSAPGAVLSLPTGAALIEGDRARIEQVIVNIISNAVKYNKGRNRYFGGIEAGRSASW